MAELCQARTTRRYPYLPIDSQREFDIITFNVQMIRLIILHETSNWMAHNDLISHAPLEVNSALQAAPLTASPPPCFASWCPSQSPRAARAADSQDLRRCDSPSALAS